VSLDKRYFEKLDRARAFYSAWKEAREDDKYLSMKKERKLIYGSR